METRVNTTKLIIIHSSRRYSINRMLDIIVAEYILRQIWLRNNYFNDFEESFIFLPSEVLNIIFQYCPNLRGTRGDIKHTSSDLLKIQVKMDLSNKELLRLDLILF